MSDVSFPLATVVRPGVFGPAQNGGHALVLNELRPATMLQLGAWPDTRDGFDALLSSILGLSVPGTPGQAAVTETTSLMALGQGRYFLASAEQGLTARLAEQIDGAQAVITDLSHARAAIRIAGAGAETVLRKGVAIDLDLRHFPPQRVAQTSFHHMGLTLHRKAPESFDLFVFRSFGISFWDSLTDAALEFGYQVIGDTAF